MPSCSASSGKPDEFTFLVSDVSISWVYLLVQMPLWQPLYLHWLNVRCCRCSFCNCCICTALIFIVADTFFETDVILNWTPCQGHNVFFLGQLFKQPKLMVSYL